MTWTKIKANKGVGTNEGHILVRYPGKVSQRRGHLQTDPNEACSYPGKRVQCRASSKFKVPRQE